MSYERNLRTAQLRVASELRRSGYEAETVQWGKAGEHISFTTWSVHLYGETHPSRAKVRRLLAQPDCPLEEVRSTASKILVRLKGF